MSSLQKQLEELNILQYSLLPGEDLSLVLPPDEREEWENLMQSFSESSKAPPSVQPPLCACRFQISVTNSPARVEIEFPIDYPGQGFAEIYVRGDGIERSEQDELRRLIKDAQDDMGGIETEYPTFNLVSSTILPLLHEKAESHSLRKSPVANISSSSESNTEPIYHALFTSHHLVSPTKRRNMQKWASDLSIFGFAKIGYPGCIYCEGNQSDVEEFVDSVKAMQWLALRLRFIEPLAKRYGRLSMKSGRHSLERRWIEFEKVGEVVEFMRQIERDNFVTEMGLGPTSLRSD